MCTTFDFIVPFSLPKNGCSSTSAVENGEVYSTKMEYFPGRVRFRNLICLNKRIVFDVRCIVDSDKSFIAESITELGLTSTESSVRTNHVLVIYSGLVEI